MKGYWRVPLDAVSLLGRIAQTIAIHESFAGGTAGDGENQKSAAALAILHFATLRYKSLALHRLFYGVRSSLATFATVWELTCNSAHISL